MSSVDDAVRARIAQYQSAAKKKLSLASLVLPVSESRGVRVEVRYFVCSLPL